MRDTDPLRSERTGPFCLDSGHGRLIFAAKLVFSFSCRGVGLIKLAPQLFLAGFCTVHACAYRSKFHPRFSAFCAPLQQ